ncbi:MAG: hypothetical protein VX404_01990 [Planctomycetota bacterium]|nr:hypothetical protein [Planctomycetota bacterium]
MIRWLLATRWKRSMLALLVLLGVLLLLGIFYIDAVNLDNHRRIEEYRQRLGGANAAEVWAVSLDRRDPQLFPLRDRSWIKQSDLIMELLRQEDENDVVALTIDQRQQIMEALRQSGTFHPPEVFDMETPFNLVEIMGIGRRWEHSGSEDSLDQQQQLVRWHQGLEFVESLSGGGVLINELVRESLLKTFLQSAHKWLDLADEQELLRVASTLSRIEPPRQALLRALQVETMVFLDLFSGELVEEYGDANLWIPICFDLKYFLDHYPEWSLDPFDQDNWAHLSEPPPYYAPITSLLTPQYQSLLNRVTEIDAQLQALRAAFDAMISRKSGQQWQPPEGIERIVNEDGTVRIRVTGGPAGTEVYLPR